MNLSHLRTFHAVAQEGGYSKAAGVLGVAQPTLSLQVRALEDRYNVKLFQKRGRGVELTPFGTELLAITARTFAGVEEAEDLLSGSRSMETGRLRLGATGPHVIVPLMRAFAERYPGPQLSLMIKNTDALEGELTAGQIDIAVLTAPISAADTEALTLRVDPIVAVVGRDHPWADKDGVSLKELAATPLVLREPGTATRVILDAALADAGLKAERVMDIDDWESMREVVAAGLGVTVLSTTDAGPNPWNRFRLLPISDAKLQVTERLVFASGRKRLRIVRTFLEVAEEFSNVEWARQLDTAGLD